MKNIGKLISNIIENMFEENYKSKLEMRQRGNQLKVENLSKVYNNLIEIINLFPELSPTDVLKSVEGGPCYSMEDFDGVIVALRYMKEDYKEQMNCRNVDDEREYHIRTQISNIDSCAKKIKVICDEYINARDKYKSFCESDKSVIELYASQEVKNCLVRFEAAIHNVFISGYSVGDICDPLNTIIEKTRRRLIDSMRNDIGIPDT